MEPLPHLDIDGRRVGGPANRMPACRGHCRVLLVVLVWLPAVVAVSIFLVATSASAAPGEYSPRARSLEWRQRYGYVASETVPFELGANGLWVPVVTAGSEGQSLRLIVDTGTHAVASLTEEAMGRVKLLRTAMGRFRDAAGRDRGEMPRVLLSALGVGPLQMRNLPVVGAGPESVQGARQGIDGTLGWGAFAAGRITIDYANRVAAFSRAPLPEEIRGCDERWVTRFESPDGIEGLPIVPANLGGELVSAEIDTGKTATLLGPGASGPPGRGPGRIEVGFALGPFSVRTRFARNGPGFEGLDQGLTRPLALGVGTDVLSGFLVTVDYPSRTVVLERGVCPGD